MGDGDTTPTGHGVIHNSGLAECIRRAQTWIRQLEPRKPNQGVGVALGLWALHPNAPGESSATVKVDDDGTATVVCGVADQGGGQWSIVASVTSEVLGIPVENVRLISADTETTPFEAGTGGSNTTYRVGNVVRQAAEDAQQQLLAAAAAQLKASPGDLEMGEGTIRKRSDPAQQLSIGAAARVAGAVIGLSGPARERELLGTADERADRVDAPSFACHAALVEVDPDTGSVQVLRYYTSQDVGKALNTLNCKGQIEGGVVFGLGYALSKELLSDQGTNLNANLWEYLLPTAPQVPALTVDLVEIPSTYGPYGAKGVGETSCIAVAPAIANAIEDAIGLRVTEAPLTPERVLRATRQQTDR